MKFKIRFAEQIVGLFIILSLASLVFVTVMLGRSQRWFARDVSFYTVLPSAAGLSKNMAVQFRGFTIGNVKNFQLTANDEVEVIFSIFEEHRDRVRLGSTVEMMISPVGLGNQFLFHTGRGLMQADGSFIPVVGSVQARELMRQGMSDDPRHDDSISLLLNRASSVLDEVNRTLVQVNDAFGAGTTATEIGKIAGSVQRTMAGVETLPQSVANMIEEIHVDLVSILANVNTITTELSDPEGLLFTALNPDGEVFVSLVESLKSISSILDNLDRATAFIPAQLPQVAGLIMDLRGTMKTAEDVLIALTNNPLLRRGVPGRPESESSGTSPRNIRF